MAPLSSDPALDSEVTSKLKSYEFQGSHFQVTRGDYAPLLQKVVEHLEKAKVGLAGLRGLGSGSPRQQTGLGDRWVALG